MTLRVLISVDIEGVAGVSRPDQTQPGSLDYDNARRLMTQEANAAIRGCFAAGATDVVAADAHASFGNLLPDLLDERARLSHGKPRPFGMLQGVEAGCDAVMMVGYHAMAGAFGVLAHTMRGTAFHRVWLNGRPVGEAALYGLLAGEHGVPVVLCSGDDAFASETREWLPQARYAVVKHAMGNRAAVSLSPARSRAMIEAEAEAALRNAAAVTPIRLAAPLTCRIEAKSVVMADLFSALPGSRRIDAMHIEFGAARASEVLGAMQLLAAASASL
jgi:D-amino peptidase